MADITCYCLASVILAAVYLCSVSHHVPTHLVYRHCVLLITHAYRRINILRNEILRVRSAREAVESETREKVFSNKQLQQTVERLQLDIKVNPAIK